MQNKSQLHFPERALYYLSRSITEQGQPGDWRYEYMPVYGVFFTNFFLPGWENRLLIDAQLRDASHDKPVTDRLRMFFIQLPYFKKKPEECDNDFERWIYLIKNLGTMQTIPFSNLNATFRRVEEVARVENLSKKERFQYEQDLKVYRDYNNIMMTAKEDGMAQGVAKMLQAMKDSGMDEAMIRQVLSKAGE